jgi:hypothetical protein
VSSPRAGGAPWRGEQEDGAVRQEGSPGGAARQEGLPGRRGEAGGRRPPTAMKEGLPGRRPPTSNGGVRTVTRHEDGGLARSLCGVSV